MWVWGVVWGCVIVGVYGCASGKNVGLGGRFLDSFPKVLIGCGTITLGKDLFSPFPSHRRTIKTIAQ